MNWIKKIIRSFSSPERRIFLLASFAVVLSAIILGTLFIKSITQVVPAEGGEYSESMVGQPVYVNPVLASGNIDSSLARLIFSNVKDLSQSIEAESGGKKWRVRLKENIFWSDGEKLTSDDIIFTIDKIKDSETGSPLAPNFQGVTATRVSQLEIVFELATPYALFEDNLQDLYVLPKHLFADVPKANWRLSEYNLKPVGSGPYKFKEYKSRNDGFITEYDLESNPFFFGDKPHIKDVSLKFFTNPEEAARSFSIGAVSAVGGISAKSLSSINRPYQEFLFSLPNYYGVFLNQSEKAALQEKDVRRALNISVDRTTLVQTVFDGKAKEVYGPVPPTLPGINSSASSSFSPETAIQILETAGWKRGEDGFFAKTTKNITTPLEIVLTVPQIPFLEETANYIKSSWEKIGVKTSINFISPDSALDEVVKNRDYEAILLGNALGPNADLFSFWHSSGRFYPGLNVSLYSNSRADSLIESMRQTLSENSRKEKLSELESLISNDYPAIFLYSPDYILITNKNVQGIEASFLKESSDRFLKISDWYVKTARVLKSKNPDK